MISNILRANTRKVQLKKRLENSRFEGKKNKKKKNKTKKQNAENRKFLRKQKMLRKTEEKLRPGAVQLSNGNLRQKHRNVTTENAILTMKTKKEKRKKKARERIEWNDQNLVNQTSMST